MHCLIQGDSSLKTHGALNMGKRLNLLCTPCTTLQSYARIDSACRMSDLDSNVLFFSFVEFKLKKKKKKKKKRIFSSKLASWQSEYVRK